MFSMDVFQNLSDDISGRILDLGGVYSPTMLEQLLATMFCGEFAFG